MVNVTWASAAAYCHNIGGLLPTEAEWEKAARGPEGLDFGTASGKLLDKEALIHGHGPRDVCSYPTNGYGLCDMTGNVWEWTGDLYRIIGIVRGGGWVYEGKYQCSAFGRFHLGPTKALPDTGFRCVVPLKAPQS